MYVQGSACVSGSWLRTGHEPCTVVVTTGWGAGAAEEEEERAAETELPCYKQLHLRLMQTNQSPHIDDTYESKKKKKKDQDM